MMSASRSLHVGSQKTKTVKRVSRRKRHMRRAAFSIKKFWYFRQSHYDSPQTPEI